MDIESLLSLSRYSQSEAEASLASGLVSKRDRRELAQHLECPGAISRAARDGYAEVTRLLLEYGAVPIYINLLEAFERGHTAVVRLLLDHVSLDLLSDILPELLSHSSTQMIELALCDRRCEPELATTILAQAKCNVRESLISYLSFERALIESRMSGIESLDWLIERDVPEARRAACAVLNPGDSNDNDYERAYYGYFCYMLGRDCDLSDLAWRLISRRCS